jgi:Xaa-Pro dipeptidase
VQHYAAHVAHLRAAYAAAAASAGVDTLILHAGSAQLRDRFDDQHHPFRPTPAFAHWLPLAEPDALLVLSGERRPRLVRPRIDDFWEAPPPPPPDWVLAEYDVEVVADPSSIALPAGRRALISSTPPGWFDADANPAALLAALDQVRTRKTEHERDCLALASDRAARGHARAAAAFLAGDPAELDLHLTYLAATDQDADDTPYKNIVALGEHAAVLHFVSYGRAAPGRAAQSLLVDAGAAALGYASDITRTTARGSGAAVELFRALIAEMDALQQEIIRRIRPGLAYEALHDQSHELLAAALVRLGVGKGSAEALVARGVTRAFYPHGLGHSLGVQVHDVGMRLTPPRADNPFLRNTSEIAEGQVFTIEPGCYVIEPLLAPLRADDRRGLVDWSLVEALRPFGGVRIEDDVAVVAGGVRDFTREAFSSLSLREAPGHPAPGAA